MTQRFAWLSRAPSIPARWDPRLLGWRLARADDCEPFPRIYDAREEFRWPQWRDIPASNLTIAVGVACPDERAAMLAAGLGDALPAEVAPGELTERMRRLMVGAGALPRYRQVGPLTLDLFHRDARAGERWLALHPREFALLWRLADAPGEPVVRETLLADVWRMAFVPETNSLEVHVSRLRAKLALVRLAWVIETEPRGGYRLALDSAPKLAHKASDHTEAEPDACPTSALP